MEFVMVMRHICIDSVLAGNKEKMYVAGRTVLRDCTPTTTAIQR